MRLQYLLVSQSFLQQQNVESRACPARSAAARNFARQASTANALTLAQKNACNVEESNMQKCFKRMTIESDGEVSKCQSYADQFKQCRVSSGLATISEDGELKMKKQNQTFAGISQYVGGMW
jgi:uncharacterized protein YdaT